MKRRIQNFARSLIVSRLGTLLCRAESAGHEARCEQVRGGFPATGAFTVGAAVEQLCGHTTYLGESGSTLARFPIRRGSIVGRGAAKRASSQ